MEQFWSGVVPLWEAPDAREIKRCSQKCCCGRRKVRACTQETFPTLRIKVGLVFFQPDGEDAVRFTGVCGIEHHGLPFTLKKKLSPSASQIHYFNSLLKCVATFPWLNRIFDISTPSSITWGSLAPARLAIVGRISRVLAISWVTPTEKLQ